MTVLSAANLENIRKQPKRTDLYLSIFQPTEVMRARVNDTDITDNARVITYDTVSVGNFSGVEAGMTLLVGSTAGADNIGRVRIKSATSTQFTVAENSISFRDNQFLTVLRYWEIWPVYPRIIPDPADDENVIFYKDYDIAYSNQNSIFGTFVCAGPHRAAFIDGANAQIYWSSEDTDPIRGTVSTYEWAFEGGTPTGSSAANPGYVTYGTPGHYVTRLRVTNSFGAVDTTYRYVSIYDRPGQGNNPPVQKWEFKQLAGSRGEAGYTASIRLYENDDGVIDGVDEGAIVVMFGEDWYGANKYSLGGNSTNNSGILFVGYVLKNSVRYNYDHSFVDFQVGSITDQMKLSEGFAISVEDKVSPATWFQLKDMTIDRAIYHYLRWHSTVLSVTDFIYTGNGAILLQYFDSDRESIFDAIDNFMRSTVVGQIVSDRQGRIYGEVNAEAVHNATGTFTTNMSLLKRDWINEPSIQENLAAQTSYLEMGGIAYYGGGIVTNFDAFMACAPGDAPGYRGRAERQQGLALETSLGLRQLVGDIWANRNAQFPSIDVQLAGSYKNLDIAPQEAIQVNIDAADTARGVDIHAPYIPTGMSYTYDAQRHILMAQATLGVVTNGRAGDNIPIPQVPDDGGFGNPSGPNIPPFPEFPPFPVNFPSGTHADTWGQWTVDVSIAGVAGPFFRPDTAGNTMTPSGDFNNGHWVFAQTGSPTYNGPNVKFLIAGYYKITLSGIIVTNDADTDNIQVLRNDAFANFCELEAVFSATVNLAVLHRSEIDLFAVNDKVSIGGCFGAACDHFLTAGQAFTFTGVLIIEYMATS